MENPDTSPAHVQAFTELCQVVGPTAMHAILNNYKQSGGHSCNTNPNGASQESQAAYQVLTQEEANDSVLAMDLYDLYTGDCYSSQYQRSLATHTGASWSQTCANSATNRTHPDPNRGYAVPNRPCSAQLPNVSQNFGTQQSFRRSNLQSSSPHINVYHEENYQYAEPVIFQPIITQNYNITPPAVPNSVSMAMTTPLNSNMVEQIQSRPVRTIKSVKSKSTNRKSKPALKLLLPSVQPSSHTPYFTSDGAPTSPQIMTDNTASLSHQMMPNNTAEACPYTPTSKPVLTSINTPGNNSLNDSGLGSEVTSPPPIPDQRAVQSFVISSSTPIVQPPYSSPFTPDNKSQTGDIKRSRKRPAGDAGSNVPSTKRPRHNQPLNLNAVRIMDDWYKAHLEKPYPSLQEKKMLASCGNISVAQVTSWFANKRNRNNNTRPKVEKAKLEEQLKKICKQLATDDKRPLDTNTLIIHQLSSLLA